jgi:quercetin dioxygenase-like cupin family protein
MSKVRRVVTASVDRHSTIVDDRRCEFSPFAPGVEICELWQVAEAPIDLGTPVIDAPSGLLMPRPGQAVMRAVRFLPSGEEGKGEENAQLAGAGDIEFKGDLHRTKTFDYAVVRKGEIWLLTEKGDTRLTVGDAVVLFGGFHSWENRTDTPAEIFSVMIGATGSGEPATCVPDNPGAETQEGLRRVIAGHDQAGSSAILSDAFLDAPIIVDPFTKVRVLWQEPAAPPANRVEGGFPQAKILIPPQDTGSSFWKVEVAPGNRPVLREHASLDFILIMEGELSYVTEDGEITLRAGDIMVQSGNSHGWRNHTSDNAALAVVHIGVRTVA